MTLPHISLQIWDVLDILLTAYFVYLVLLIMRGTRGMQILQGLALLLILRAVSQYFHLWTVFSLLNALLIVSGVAIPIVFQPELRRALAQLGRAGFHEGPRQGGASAKVRQACDIMGTAATVLSRSAIGAIIVVERHAVLDEYVETGTKIDALLSAEVLLSIFSPRSPLHDGAAIVRDDRVRAAGCFLPLSEAVLLDRRMGTRHRAALGVTEQTDSVALVVSEETGAIVIARDGRLEEQPQNARAVANALAASLAWQRGRTPRTGTIVEFARTLFQRVHVTSNGLDKTKLRS
jgi:diadenylate cyclase